ncbi:hypothetical protein [Streptomyces sp. MMG1533]|uniref:hypothetical protein n=1 Tax=Streptomyces sp. MMG1533 TaxID=1415546 RepID=UPI000A4FC616|nr:hypothetical protein [Streptomyces sp. MMG1533]
MADDAKQQIAAYEQGAAQAREFQTRMLAAGDPDTAQAASQLTDGYLDAINNTNR